MSTSYHIYKNNGLGGPIDYTTVVTTTASLTYVTAALTYPGDWRFAVRAFDTVTLYEDQGTDAVTRIVLNSAGADITLLPPAPLHIDAHATAGGDATAEWTINPGASAAPFGFYIWLTVGSTTNYTASPVATVAYHRGQVDYRANLTGLADGTAYVVAVRSYNGTGTETNTTIVAPVTGDSTGPSPVDGLTATATYAG